MPPTPPLLDDSDNDCSTHEVSLSSTLTPGNSYNSSTNIDVFGEETPPDSPMTAYLKARDLEDKKHKNKMNIESSADSKPRFPAGGEAHIFNSLFKKRCVQSSPPKVGSVSNDAPEKKKDTPPPRAKAGGSVSTIPKQ